MIRLLMHTFLALTELKLGLTDLPEFITSTTWREQLLLNVRHRGAALTSRVPENERGARNGCRPE